MIARRRLASAARPRTRKPSASGPRCAMSAAIACAGSRPRPTALAVSYVPAIPHMSRLFVASANSGRKVRSPHVQLSGKRFLVTGGAGFIGRYVVAQLLEKFAQVRVFEQPG